MGTRFDTLRGFFALAEWPVMEIDAGVTVAGNYLGNNGTWMVVASVSDDPPQFLIYSRCPVPCPPDRRAAMANFLHRCNWGFTTGCFELNPNDGEVRFRVGANLPEDPAASPYASLVRHNVGLFDHALPAMLAIMHGDTTAAEAIAMVERRSAPEETA